MVRNAPKIGEAKQDQKQKLDQDQKQDQPQGPSLCSG
jgi:hypothetical protein